MTPKEPKKLPTHVDKTKIKNLYPRFPDKKLMDYINGTMSDHRGKFYNSRDRILSLIEWLDILSYMGVPDGYSCFFKDGETLPDKLKTLEWFKKFKAKRSLTQNEK